MTNWANAIGNFYGKYFVSAANGTTAMYLLFRVLRLQKKKALFPAISCTGPVNAAIFAGYDVCFADVREDDYVIDLDKAETILRTGQVGVMIPTHIYGHMYDREKARFICEKHGVFLLEDAAQTVDVDGADASVVSFGHTKIFEADTGGGILSSNLSLVNDISREKLAFCESEVPIAEDAFDSYRSRYYAIVKDQSLSEARRYGKLHELQLDSRQYFISPDEASGEDIMRRLDDASSIMKKRIEKAQLYEKLLDKKFVTLPKVDFAARAVWRFTFLANSKRDELLEAARQKDIDISSWYLPLHKIYETNDMCPAAEYVSDHVVNLWVDESHNLDGIRYDCEILNKIFTEI